MCDDAAAQGVILSPHPDDAVLSAWSALRGSGEVVVVNVCSTAPPTGTLGAFDPVFGATDSSALWDLRLAEDADALAVAGRSRINLGFLEDQYRDGLLAAGDLRGAIEATLDEVAWLCAPAGIGSHPDHVVTRTVALEMAQAHDIPLSLYADLPYAIWAGWPHWVTGAEPQPYLVPEARWHEDLHGLHDVLAPRPRALGDAEAARKLTALQKYRTQFAALDAGPIKRISNPQIIGYELHWDVRV